MHHAPSSTHASRSLSLSTHGSVQDHTAHALHTQARRPAALYPWKRADWFAKAFAAEEAVRCTPSSPLPHDTTLTTTPPSPPPHHPTTQPPPRRRRRRRRRRRPRTHAHARALAVVSRYRCAPRLPLARSARIIATASCSTPLRRTATATAAASPSRWTDNNNNNNYSTQRPRRSVKTRYVVLQ